MKFLKLPLNVLHQALIQTNKKENNKNEGSPCLLNRYDGPIYACTRANDGFIHRSTLQFQLAESTVH